EQPKENGRGWWIIRCLNNECWAHLKMINRERDDVVARWNKRVPIYEHVVCGGWETGLDVTEEMPR
ncbi:hypothetical protein LCGC14_0641970, partial [marine sediment metagenome]